MRRSKAFTLIELLVVIAIIAILAAILFPVFAQAKAAAKGAAALSNMKQMATASKIYAGDYDDVSVYCWWEPNYPDGYARHWVQRLYPYVKSSGIYIDPLGPTVAPTPADMSEGKGSVWAAGGNYAVTQDIAGGRPDSGAERPSELINFMPTGTNTWIDPNGVTLTRSTTAMDPWHDMDNPGDPGIYQVPKFSVQCQQKYDAYEPYNLNNGRTGWAVTWRHANAAKVSYFDGHAGNVKKNALKPTNMYYGAVPQYAIDDPANQGKCGWPNP